MAGLRTAAAATAPPRAGGQRGRWPCCGCSGTFRCSWSASFPGRTPRLLFALTFVFTSIYLRTAGSVPVAFLLHATINGAGGFFVPLFAGDDRVRMYWLAAVLCAVIALVAIVASPHRWRRVPAASDLEAAPIEAPRVTRGSVRERRSAYSGKPEQWRALNSGGSCCLSASGSGA